MSAEMRVEGVITEQEFFEEGACLCGQVRFKVRGQPLLTLACHCAGCKRLTASAFGLAALYPVESLEITDGQPVIGALHGADRHFFCPYCMSWLYNFPHGMEFIAVRATMLDSARSFRPFMEVHTSEKLPWATTPAVHSFEKLPLPEELSRLVAEFTALKGQDPDF